MYGCSDTHYSEQYEIGCSDTSHLRIARTYYRSNSQHLGLDMSALTKDVEDFNNRDALNAQAPDEPFYIPVAYISVQNESGTRWEPGNSLCASQTSHPKCPVCDCELTFLPPDTTFEVNFDNKTHIKHAATNNHSNNWHPEEPLWNSLPKLDLEALYTNHLRGQKTKSGPVEKFLDYTLRKAAELIPLLKPSGTCWLLHWTFARHVFLLAHLSAAQHMTNDPLMFIKRCTNEHAPGTWNSDWHDWICETARSLIETVIAQDIQDVKLASMTSIP